MTIVLWILVLENTTLVWYWSAIACPRQQGRCGNTKVFFKYTWAQTEKSQALPSRELY